MKIMFWENHKYYQIGNAYFQYDKNVKKSAPPHNLGNPPNQPDLDLTDGDEIPLMKIGFAITFKQVNFNTTRVGDLEQYKYVGQGSKMMTL